ncbi:TonB-dependent receptor [Glycocaulis profundi]|nr:TonB-dependent receptor [Glycocaulis profundi]
MKTGSKRIRALLGATALSMGGTLGIAAIAAPAAQAQETYVFDIPAQKLGPALEAFSSQSGVPVMFDEEHLDDLDAGTVSGDMTAAAALERLLAGHADVSRQALPNGSFVVRRGNGQPVTASQPAPEPEPAPAPEPLETASRPGIETITVTARRMEERIIDVPLSVSAFSMQQLDDLKIEGGSELLRAIPNVAFSKDNFTGYNFSIRGIGTKATSVTADPGVAISFNNTPLLRNRLFEQEYVDVQRLEVLRGPQGTLYGRNATAGVVNMLPNLPDLSGFYGDVQVETGNYDARRARGHVNIPLSEQFAIRAAGAWTQRDGYDYNLVTDNRVNGRDMWSARLSALWQPTERLRVSAIYERFEEDSDRSRTGKQLCTRGAAPETIDYRAPSGEAASADVWKLWTISTLTPGCQAASLFTEDAFGVADSFGSPMVTGMLISAPYRTPIPEGMEGSLGYPDEYLSGEYIDPFNTGDGRQSTNLREIETFYDPVYQAESDVIQFNIEYDVTDHLTLYSQTLYMEDSYYGSQDFLRSQPASGLFRRAAGYMGRPCLTNLANTDPSYSCEADDMQPLRPYWNAAFNPYGFGFSPEDSEAGGVFIDPQLGAADHAQAVDISQATSRQWSQEFRIQSSFDGPFNFNLGANYLKFNTEEDYYVFSNLFTIMAMHNNGQYASGHASQNNPYSTCGSYEPSSNPNDNSCIYIDPNPIDQIDGDGHNYLRNTSIAQTESWSVFGEAYVNLSDTVRLTAGLRYTDDTKTMTPVPSQLLASTSFLGGYGPESTDLVVSRGHPRYPDETRGWQEVTGRLAIDWKPELAFTDETLIYASFARGYKGGGGNPSGPVVNEETPTFAPLPDYYAPEYVNAFEIGTKNEFDNGRVMVNVTGFYYDYQDYQISQLLDRGFHIENFDARVWGLEFETAWSPMDNLRVDATLGYLNTRIANGERSIDVMNRTAGNDDWIVVRPWATSPYTCIVPKDIIGRYITVRDGDPIENPTDAQRRGDGLLARSFCPQGPLDSWGVPQFGPGSPNEAQYGFSWDPVTDARGGGRGFYTELGGHHLPNAPELTFNVGVQYRIDLPAGWDLTVRGDYYRQSHSYMRVYNTEYDRLKGWDNANLSATLFVPDYNVQLQAYVKNVFDRTPITDGFTGPDELGNFTNVFTLDPRIVGLSLRASF